MLDAINSAALLLVLLNPLLLIIYLLDLVQKLSRREFSLILYRAGWIATLVFFVFVLLGDVVFSRVLNVNFASFQIFGGIIFLLIGLQFVFKGPTALTILQGESEHLAGAVAMPVLVGPGTISASVVIGQRHEPLVAMALVLVSVSVCLVAMLGLKVLHDIVKTRNEALVERYIEIGGRVMALVVGTIAVEMIMNGLLSWSGKF